MISIDTIYYGARALVHTNLDLGVKIVTFICISMVLYDLSEIWILSSLANVREDFVDSDKRNKVAPMKSKSLEKLDNSINFGLTPSGKPKSSKGVKGDKKGIFGSDMDA